MDLHRTCLVSGVLAALSAVAPAEPAAVATPRWATGASWYRVFVPRFHNGDPTNDPTGTKAWTAAWTSRGVETEPNAIYKETAEPYGGDLQGLRARLPYLKRLGVEAIYLSPVFVAPSDHKYDPDDLRHIDDSLAVAGSLDKIRGESRGADTWKFSESDRLFLAFLEDAHGQGMRVVVEAVFSQTSRNGWVWNSILRNQQQSPVKDWLRITAWTPRISWETDTGYAAKLLPFRLSGDGFSPDLESYLYDISKHWMDPDGDGDPSDGIDGWGVFDAARMPRGTLQRWHEQIRRVNPEAVLVGDFSGDFPSGEPVQPARDEFDLTIEYDLGRELARFFYVSNENPDAKRLMRALSGLHSTEAAARANAVIAAAGGASTGRLLTGIAFGSGDHAGGTLTGPASPGAHSIDRWRLAVALQYLASGSPMLFNGDEVGMYAYAGPDTRAPMWWKDLPDAAAKPVEYREDFVALIRQLNGLRRRFAPLVGGTFRQIPTGDAPDVLGFSRALPGDEIIVLLNNGDATREVQLSAGWPGQLVGIVHPELKPGPLHPLLQRKQMAAQKKGDAATPGLRLFGSRQYADDWGDITVRITPNSVRLIIVRDEEPR